MAIAWLSNLEEIRTNLNSPCTFSSIWKKIQKKNTSCIITVSFEISYHCYSLSSFLITARNQSLTHIFENSKNENQNNGSFNRRSFNGLFCDEMIVWWAKNRGWFTVCLRINNTTVLVLGDSPIDRWRQTNATVCVPSIQQPPLHDVIFTLQTKKDNCSSFIFFQWHFFYRDMNYWKAPKNWNRAKIRCSHQ